MIYNLDYNDFHLDEVYVNILHNYSIDSPEELVDALEVYNILNRDDIIRHVNEVVDDSSKHITSVAQHNSFELSDRLIKIMSKHNILLEVSHTNPTVIYVIQDMFQNVNLSVLLVDLMDYQVEFKYVTPYNFKVLTMDCYVPKYNYLLLAKCIVHSASMLHVTDIHFETYHEHNELMYAIFFRMGNSLVSWNGFSLTKDMIRQLFHGLVSLSNSNSADIDSYGVSTVVYDFFGDGSVNLRISGERCVGGYFYVIRLQNAKTTTLTIDQLGFDEVTCNDLIFDSKKTGGLTLITGAVRTGKNTTAFALCRQLDLRPISIIEFSSPPETHMPFPQVDYLNDVNLLLNDIELAKKQDVDVAFLGEIPTDKVAFAVRDLVNSSIHVITTFHINRIWHLPHKLYEFYGDSYKDVITQLNAVFNQKMYIRQCKECQDQTVPRQIEDKRVRDFLSTYGVNKVFLNRGCQHCNDGILTSEIQPYCESLVFTDKMKRDLLKLNHPYEMELYIHDYVLEHKLSLEFKVCNAIQNGDLPFNSVYSLL